MKKLRIAFRLRQILSFFFANKINRFKSQCLKSFIGYIIKQIDGVCICLM